MSDIVLSKNQELAVNTTDKNILVSAAAGSGKTFVLVQRILKMITQDNVDIDSLLIVTFSQAAANEMRDRIGKAISKALSGDPHNKNLQKQALLLNKASISTIDAFCGSIVRNNFYKTDIDPGYRIISDSDEIKKIRLQAIDELFNTKYKDENDDFIKLVDAYCKEYKDDTLVDMIFQIYDKACDNPYVRQWLEMCRDNYNIDKYGSFYNTPFGIELKNTIKNNYDKIKLLLDKMNNYSDFNNYYDDLEYINEFCDILQFNNIEDISQDIFPKINKIVFTDNVNKDFHSLYLEATMLIKETISLFIDRNSTETVLKNQFPLVNTLINLIIEFSEIYKELKLDMKAAEFNDIQHYALNILRDENGEPTEVANSFKEKYYEIIIDEYQDSNNLQEAIFTSFSRGNNMFMVGDIKQSIYKFRQANPDLFKLKYNTFPNDKDSVLIQLSENYRSKSCVLDFCNHIFGQVMTDEFGEVDYTDEVALKSTDKNPEIYYNTDIHILEGVKDLPEELIGLNNTDYEANYIAEQIKIILENNPEVSPSDIAILSRKKKSVFYLLLNALASRGIAASAENQSSFNATLEVQTIIALLKIIDNPYDNIPIITVLHSYIYNISDGDLVKIKLADKSEFYYNNILKYIENNKDDLANNLCRFINDIAVFRKYAMNNSIAKLLSYLYDMTGYATYVSLLPNGKQRQTNLKLFIEIAENYEKYTNCNLKTFIDYIEVSENINEATVSADSIESVKIVTMHSSKGLEYPIVIIGFTGANLKKARQYPIIHPKFGFALKYIKDEHYILDTQFGDLLKFYLNKEELSESLRLLYVALTRAKEKLIITGIGPKKNPFGFMDLDVSNPLVECLNSSNYLNWIMSCLKHKEFKGAKEIYVPFDENIFETNKFNEKSFNILNELKSIDTKKIYGDKYDEISNNLTYEYHNQKALELPVKASISEIKRMYTSIDSESDNIFTEIEFNMPDFISDKSDNISGAKRGTIYHCVFEHMDFLNINTKNDIKLEIQNMIDSRILTEKEAQVINIDRIYAFVKSDLYKRIQKSEGIYKEIPFMMNMKASEIYGDEYKEVDNNIAVRGIIDLYFIEKGNIILVDYKTDTVKNHNLNSLVEKYRVQLELYKKALQDNTGMNVSECIIYSVSEDCEIKL